MQRLVLFDIDGTLLSSHGAGRRAMEAALLEVFGSEGIAGVSIRRQDRPADRARPDARRRTCDATIDARMPQVLDEYVDGPAARTGVAAHPRRGTGGSDVRSSTRSIRASHCIVGLLTGNLERGAQHKLSAAGIDFTRFALGAYGSDHEVARRTSRHRAASRARASWGSSSGERRS